MSDLVDHVNSQLDPWTLQEAETRLRELAGEMLNLPDKIKEIGLRYVETKIEHETTYAAALVKATFEDDENNRKTSVAIKEAKAEIEAAEAKKLYMIAEIELMVMKKKLSTVMAVNDSLRTRISTIRGQGI